MGRSQRLPSTLEWQRHWPVFLSQLWSIEPPMSQSHSGCKRIWLLSIVFYVKYNFKMFPVELFLQHRCWKFRIVDYIQWVFCQHFAKIWMDLNYVSLTQVLRFTYYIWTIVGLLQDTCLFLDMEYLSDIYGIVTYLDVVKYQTCIFFDTSNT